MILKTLKTLCVLMFFCAGTACAQTVDCEVDNAALQAMSKSLVTLIRSDGTRLEFEVKTAANNRTRSAGFQRVCESTIKAKPILFVFEREFQPRFHMNNVVAAIDIAFFNQQGQINSIQTMQPYVVGGLKKPLYGPSAPVIGALEVHEGFYTKNRIDTDTRLYWRKASQ